MIGSWLPYILSEYFGIANRAEEGSVPLNLILSFVLGAVVLVLTILVTVFTIKEYSPEEVDKIEKAKAQKFDEIEEEDDPEKAKLSDIFTDFVKMPATMKQLSWVQFFSWFGLFWNVGFLYSGHRPAFLRITAY